MVWRIYLENKKLQMESISLTSFFSQSEGNKNTTFICSKSLEHF